MFDRNTQRMGENDGVFVSADVLYSEEDKKRQEQHSNSIFTDMSSFPLHYIISTQSPNHNLHSKQIVKYEWPLYIRIDMSPAVGFLHDNEARLHT